MKWLKDYDQIFKDLSTIESDQYTFLTCTYKIYKKNAFVRVTISAYNVLDQETILQYVHPVQSNVIRITFLLYTMILINPKN